MAKAKFVFSPDVIDLKEIDNIVEDIDRYGSRDEFLRESIDLMIMWWRHPENIMAKSKELWPDYTSEMKRQIKDMNPDFYNAMENNPEEKDSSSKSYLEVFSEKIQKNRNFFKGKKAPICKECIPSSNPPLMNKLQTRFFPSKLVTCLLAKAIVENIEKNNDEWIDYESFRKNSFEEILEISKIIKHYEEENKIPRSKRISTGFPVFHEKTFEDREEEFKNILRIKASKERFLEQFVGPTVRAFKQSISGTISGILNDMGLVQIRKTDDDSLEITLSKNGMEFLKLPNPIIDNQDLSHSIDNDEKEFILENVIPKFDLEKLIIDAILNSVTKKGELNVKDIDDVIDTVKTKWCNIKSNVSVLKDYKIERVDSDYWKNVRMSTMGRLSEIGAVNWIIESGLSKYNLTSIKKN